MWKAFRMSSTLNMPATATITSTASGGRTGRAERRGDAFTLVTPDDRDVHPALEKIMGKRCPADF